MLDTEKPYYERCCGVFDGLKFEVVLNAASSLTCSVFNAAATCARI